MEITTTSLRDIEAAKLQLKSISGKDLSLLLDKMREGRSEEIVERLKRLMIVYFGNEPFVPKALEINSQESYVGYQIGNMFFVARVVKASDLDMTKLFPRHNAVNQGYLPLDYLLEGLVNSVKESFDIDELKTEICWELGTDPEMLAWKTIGQLVEAIIRQMAHENKLELLINLIIDARPALAGSSSLNVFFK